MDHPKQGGVAGLVHSAQQMGQAIVTAALNRIQLMQLLAAYEKEPAEGTKAASDLSDQQAFDLLMHLVYKGEILLDETIRTGPGGSITQPRPGQQMKVRAHMAGVEYKHASNPAIHHFTPKPSLAIALYRLATTLGGGYYGVKQIIWGGIGHGHEGKRMNCHEVGTCVDIYGVLTRLGKFDVLKNWGMRPVFRPDGTKLPASHGDPWGNATKTYYRLRSSDGGLPFYFFQELYRVGREQFTAGATDNIDLQEGQVVRQGANIFHPDYPGIDLRRSHQEHMHFQIGPSYL